MSSTTPITVILGTQWGDEGKGKVVDLLSSQVDLVIRTAGGSNAGHTIVVDKKSYALHLIPSGILYDSVKCLIGNGVVVHLPTFFEELRDISNNGLNYKNRIFISDRAHLLFDFHQKIDDINERELGISKIGTTKRGIGPCYSTKAERTNLRVVDLLNFDVNFIPRFKKLCNNMIKRFPDLKFDIEAEIDRYREYSVRVKEFVIDGVCFVNECFKDGKRIIIEGANAAMLDIEFGTYPFVTSSVPTIGGCISGAGVSCDKIGRVIGIVKAYTTKVGSGIFPTELDTDVDGTPGHHLLNVGREYGTTTGRARRCGWLDLVQLKYSNLINGYTDISITKLDVLTGLNEIKVAINYIYEGEKLKSFPADLTIIEKCVVEYKTFPGWQASLENAKEYSDLPLEARNYLEFIENELKVRINCVGTGASRDKIIFLK